MPIQKKIIIAIDGYASTGKSTFAKSIAQTINYKHIDTGALYRGVCLFCLDKGLISNSHISLNNIIQILPEINLKFDLNNTLNTTLVLNNKDISESIRSVQISSLVSKIATIPEVRKFVDSFIINLKNDKGIVVDGRDIGTNVFPDAELKIFMTASIEARTQRRYNELIKKGIKNITIQEIESNLKSRDWDDINRKISPLIKAKDAILLDNSNMTINEQLTWIMPFITEACTE